MVIATTIVKILVEVDAKAVVQKMVARALVLALVLKRVSIIAR